MICPICKKPVKEGALYCTSCGGELEKKYYCPYCGTKNFRGEKCEVCEADYDEYIEYVEKGFEEDREKKKQLTEEELLAPFEYIKKATGTYAVTGLKDKSVLKIEIPSCVEEIGEEAFACTNLVEVILNEGLIKIGARAFMWCKNLLTINIPKTLLWVEEEAFKGVIRCKLFKPDWVEIVGEDAFGAELEIDGEFAYFGFYENDGEKTPLIWQVIEETEEELHLLCTKVLDECENEDKTSWILGFSGKVIYDKNKVNAIIKLPQEEDLKNAFLEKKYKYTLCGFANRNGININEGNRVKDGNREIPCYWISQNKIFYSRFSEKCLCIPFAVIKKQK